MAESIEPGLRIPARPRGRPRSSVHRRAERGAWLRRRTLKIAAFATIGLLITGGLVSFGLAAGLASLPNADALVSAPLASDTLVYDRSGQVLLADLHPEGYQHYETSLSGMGKWLPMATVAVEDSNFWNEPGVDPFSMARAAMTDFQRHSAVQGGSTITQQLVKQRLVGSDTSITRKLREAALAMRISSDFSKSQILAMYLNAIAYGNAAYGAQAAARIYFHTDASKLDLAQASLVAGLPQNPTLLNPLQHWQVARQRQQEVLAAMVRNRNITQEEADQAYAEDLSARIYGPDSTNLAPGFISWLVSELNAKFGQSAVQQGGMKVISTIDWGLQQLAQQSVADTVQSQGYRHLTDGALVAIDPRTGQVLAMVGSAGPNVPGGQFNMAAYPPRNPGSSFKVFTYTAAIDSRRYTMVTPIVDAPLTVQMAGASPYTPQNYDHRYHGTCQVQVCLGNSLNIPAVEVEMGTGVAAVADEARKMGAPPYYQPQGGSYTNNVPSSNFTPSLTLGGYGETPLQMATGVASLAAGGVEHPPEGVVSVTSSGGQVLLRPGTGGQRVIDEGTAYIVSQMLSDAANRALIFGRNTPLTLAGHRAAAKTGTTDKFNDAWTIGYTPSLATAVWMGNTDNSPMTSGSDGIYVAAPAWHEFMQAALDRMNRGDEWFQQPADVTMDNVNGRPAWFLAGTSAATPPPPLPSTVHVAGGDCGGDTCQGNGGRRCRPLPGFPFIQPCLPAQTVPPQVAPGG
jgi:membrane peptidoglycan carboxypeptidase